MRHIILSLRVAIAISEEKNQRLGDTLNARTFALAERTGLPFWTTRSLTVRHRG